MLKTILWILLALLGGYVGLVLLMFAFQHKLFFHPDNTLSYDPGAIGLKYESVTFRTQDSLNLHGWYIPHDNPRGSVLFLHGNAGDIGDRMDTIQQLHRFGLNQFIFDYRGYGKSEGAPSEEGLYEDARAAYRYLIEQKQVEPSRLVIMGRSLGGAVAGWLAAHEQSGPIILESSFTSAPEVAADVYPYLPARYMIRFHFPLKSWVQKIRKPILVAHSKQDQLIPYAHGQELYRAAYPPKKFLELEGNHASGFMDTGKKYQRTIQNFLQKYLPPQ